MSGSATRDCWRGRTDTTGRWRTTCSTPPVPLPSHTSLTTRPPSCSRTSKVSPLHFWHQMLQCLLIMYASDNEVTVQLKNLKGQSFALLAPNVAVFAHNVCLRQRSHSPAQEPQRSVLCTSDTKCCSLHS